jgi:hypothetical protein
MWSNVESGKKLAAVLSKIVMQSFEAVADTYVEYTNSIYDEGQSHTRSETHVLQTDSKTSLSTGHPSV